MGLAFSTALLVALVAAVFRSEFEAWMPWFAKMLRRAGVRLSPAPLRERLAEEWEAYLEEVPGHLAKVACALGFVAAGLNLSMRANLRMKLASVFLMVGRIVGDRSRAIEGSLDYAFDADDHAFTAHELRTFARAISLKRLSISLMLASVRSFEPMNDEQVRRVSDTRDRLDKLLVAAVGFERRIANLQGRHRELVRLGVLRH